jgi:CarD family transcriptional regulator
MYKVGDLIIYGNIGVCEVADIMTPGFSDADKSQLFYELKPLSQNGTIYTPVSTKVFMRPIITADEAERLIDMIPTIQPKAYHTGRMNELAQHYESAMKTHDCSDLLELSMSIYAKKKYLEENGRKFGQIDDRYMKRAEELLYTELSAALSIPKEKMPEYIASRVEKADDNNIRT